MTLSEYLNIQEIIMAVIMVLGLQLIFENVPKELKGSHVHVASQVMGVAMTIIPIFSFIYYFTKLRYAGPLYDTALNLTAYCITSTLVAMSYFILLDKVHEVNVIRAHLIIGFAYPFPMWLVLWLCSEFVANLALVASYTMFVMTVIVHIVTSIHYYTHAIKDRCSYHSDVMLKFLGRILNVSVILVVVGVFAPSFNSYPMWLGKIFVSMFLLGSM